MSILCTIKSCFCIYKYIYICLLELVCTTIKVVTKKWGEENSWTFGECSSAQVYEAKEIYTEECCQLEGNYELVCKDQWGDGWHGGYIQIGDDTEKWCKDFKSGKEQSQEVEMTGKSEFGDFYALRKTHQILITKIPTSCRLPHINSISIL